MTVEKTYTRDEVVRDSLEYFKGDQFAADVFPDKYALMNDGVWYESNPEHMHRRMTREFFRIESKYVNPMSEDEIFELFDRFKYVIPQGSPMSAIGNPFQFQSLSNCFVVDSPYDSYNGIHYTDEQLTAIMKRRGGVGFDISTLRPAGMATSNAARTTDGIGVFMERYSNTTREVAQGGRRGALILLLSDHHPQFETFTNIKRDRKKVTGANISFKFHDDFMQAVESNSDIELRFPVDPSKPAVMTKKESAKRLFDVFVDSSWDSAEPGAIFWDTVVKNSPADLYSNVGFSTKATNPCSELPLAVGDSCRLLLLNLYSFVERPFTDHAVFDYDKFAAIVVKAQRLMDDLVDLEIEAIDGLLKKIESDPEPEYIKNRERELWTMIRDKAVAGRRTGLGVTGLGDMLAALGIKYGSKESKEMTERVYKILSVNSYTSSIILAMERGSFPICDPEMELKSNHPFLTRIKENLFDEYFHMWKACGRRNIANLTTPPAGSTSMFTQTTAGFEPLLFMKQVRRKKIISSLNTEARVDFVDDSGDRWQEYEFVHPKLLTWMEVTGKTDVEESPYFGATAEEINPLDKVEMQASAQKWVDHSISVTHNLPADATRQQVSDLYMTAWRLGCKGLTVYRKGCRDGVIIEKKDNQPKIIIESHAPKRPKELVCDIHKVTIKGEQWTIIVGLFEDKPYEIFGGLSQFVSLPKKYKKGVLVKNGRKDGLSTYNLVIRFSDEDDDRLIFKNIVDMFENPTHGAWTRTLSLSLRHGIPVQYIVEQCLKDKYSDMQSFSRVIARVLKGYIKDGTQISTEVCPECKSPLQYSGGCVCCSKCAWSRCS